MRTTDSTSALAPSPARTPLRNTPMALLCKTATVCRGLIFHRRRNSLHSLSERQLRDIGLTIDMLDHDIVVVGETEQVRISRRSQAFPSVLLLLLSRGGA
ncbi:DUF1127 domain-containing protein [Rhizobium sp. RU36D]|uniref:DUF1127 domain-containing protein n=1 Tax=Rhizobium sp. RU36D TaxID=1907415 RepID=UPI0009D8D282|nr:DUF1127 domain-containing protein [Rhizobium sp. RU36D]SMD11481.1 protein of unknown function [Rhizobium sp. RU36D]